MFSISGIGLHFVKRFSNEGKKTRWNRDLWDRVSSVYGPHWRSERAQNVLANSLAAK